MFQPSFWWCRISQPSTVCCFQMCYFSVLFEEDHNPSMRFDSSSKPTCSSTSQWSLVAASSLENFCCLSRDSTHFSERNQPKTSQNHSTSYPYILVGGLQHVDYFSHHIGNFIIPTDEVILFRGVGSTTNQYSYRYQRLMVPTVDNV